MRRGSLASSETVEGHRRPFFHPRGGWVRRGERALSNFLARTVWPGIPFACRVYGRILDSQLTLSEATVYLRSLPAGAHGLRLLLLTDVHAGPFLSAVDLERTFGRLLAVEPDAILLGGDLTTCRVEELASHERAFRSLRAPLGVWAVLGNHDHYTSRPVELRAGLERMGIHTLHNSNARLVRRGAAVSLAGVDDLLHGTPDLDRALEGAHPPVILLSHNPDVLFEAARRRVALVLSGHTHGGQIRLPGLPVLVRQSRYRLDEGRYEFDGTQLVVSRGLGAVGLPWRAWCPPEAILLTLSCAGDAPRVTGVPRE